MSLPRSLFYLNFNFNSIQNFLEHKKGNSSGPHNKVDEPSLQRGDCDSKQGVTNFSVGGIAELETAASRNI